MNNNITNKQHKTTQMLKRIRNTYLTDPTVKQGTYATTLLALGSNIQPLQQHQIIPNIEPLTYLTSLLACGMLVSGLMWLLLCWIKLRNNKHLDTTATFILWTLPLLFAAPLFSNDMYSYAAQGLITLRGMNPYLSGPIVVPGPYADQIDPTWLYAPAPYGPLALKIQETIVYFTQNNAYLSAITMRLPATITTITNIGLMNRLCKLYNLNRKHIIWLTMLNPVTITHLIGGAHNDAVMLMFVLAAIYYATTNHTLTSLLCVAAATGVKQTAIITIIATTSLTLQHAYNNNKLSYDNNMLSWLTYVKQRTKQSFKQVTQHDVNRNRDLTLEPVQKVSLVHFIAEGIYSTVIVTTIFYCFTKIVGLNFDWIYNFDVPLSINSLLSPATLTGNIIYYAQQFFNIQTLTQIPIIKTTQQVSITVGAMLMILFAVTKTRTRPVTGLAYVWSAFILFSPVIHPWYLIPVYALLALSDHTNKYDNLIITLTIILTTYTIFDTGFVWGAVIFSIAAAVRLLILFARKPDYQYWVKP